MPAELILQHWTAADAVRCVFVMKAGQLPLSVGWLWFLQQYRRWGMWQGDGDQAVVAASTRLLYEQAARACGLPLPAADRHSVLMDGCHWPEPAGARPVSVRCRNSRTDAVQHRAENSVNTRERHFPAGTQIAMITCSGAMACRCTTSR
jgi:hypothetical protein